jgi:hypothetical protein
MSENFYGRMNLTPIEVELAASVPKAAQPKPRPLSEALLSPPRADLRTLAIRRYAEPDLIAIRAAWGDFQSDRSRDAIYDYLQGVFALVLAWKGRGEIKGHVARLIKTYGMSSRVKAEPFSVVIIVHLTR